MIRLDFESVSAFSIYIETFGNIAVFQYVFSEMTIFRLVHDVSRLITFTGIKLIY